MHKYLVAPLGKMRKIGILFSPLGRTHDLQSRHFRVFQRFPPTPPSLLERIMFLGATYCPLIFPHMEVLYSPSPSRYAYHRLQKNRGCPAIHGASATIITAYSSSFFLDSSPDSPTFPTFNAGQNDIGTSCENPSVSNEKSRPSILPLPES